MVPDLKTVYPLLPYPRMSLPSSPPVNQRAAGVALSWWLGAVGAAVRAQGH